MKLKRFAAVRFFYLIIGGLTSYAEELLVAGLDDLRGSITSTGRLAGAHDRCAQPACLIIRIALL